MGWNDHMYDNCNKYIEECPHCGKKFLCKETNQVPGFRDRDSKICPYCHSEICSSMEVEYDCQPMAETD